VFCGIDLPLEHSKQGDQAQRNYVSNYGFIAKLIPILSEIMKSYMIDVLQRSDSEGVEVLSQMQQEEDCQEKKKLYQ